MNPPLALYAPLPLRITDSPSIVTAKAACTKLQPKPLSCKELSAEVVSQYLIGPWDMEMIYMSADPYGHSFEASLDLHKCDLRTHHTAGLRFLTKNGCLLLANMDPGTPGAKVDKWRTHLRGAWLTLIAGTPVHTIADTQAAFASLSGTNVLDCTLVFSHPEISPDILNRGVPIMSREDFSQFTHDQLNNQVELLGDPPSWILRTRCYDIVNSGKVLNYTTRVMRLMRGRLIQQDDWNDWQHSEYLQLDQYSDQGCFGTLTAVDKDDAVFHLV
jgi:hypothetical protein